MSLIWLRSDKASKHTWLEKLNYLPETGFVFLEDHFKEAIASDSSCICIKAQKSEKHNGISSTLVACDCDIKKSVICALDSFKSTAMTKRVKFPCIPKTGRYRKKRHPSVSDRDDTHGFVNQKLPVQG